MLSSESLLQNEPCCYYLLQRLLAKLWAPVKGDSYAWQCSWCAWQPAVLTANMGGASLNGECNPDDEYAALSLSPSLTTSSSRVCARWSSVGQCGYCDCERAPYKNGGSHLCWPHFLLSSNVRTSHPTLNLTGYSAPCNIKFISHEETTVYGATWSFKDVSYRRGAPHNGKCLQGECNVFFFCQIKK